LKDLDPDIEGSYSFKDQEIDLNCVHERGKDGQMYESWTREKVEPNLADKTLLRHFDRLLDEKTNGGVTDDDVPF